MRKINLIGTSAFIILTVFQSCQVKENAVLSSNETADDNVAVAVTQALSSSLEKTSIQDINSLSFESYDGNGEAMRIYDGYMHNFNHMHYKLPHVSDCATVTVSDTVYPKEIVIDYGTSCTDHHNHTISGKIIINISDTLKNAGSLRTIVFQDFYVDSVKVELTATYKNLGITDDSIYLFAKAAHQVLTLEDATIVEETSQDTTKWISGFLTTTKSDDIFYKYGQGTITIDDSLIYSRSITMPLLYDFNCDYITSGIMVLYKDGNSIIIDYGDGTCDNTAIVTTNGTTEEIDLKALKQHHKGGHGKGCKNN